MFKQKRGELFISLVFVGFILVMASCLIYYVENEAQPEAFSSIPAAMWWGAATLTTVGYGDIYPITPLGRFLGSIIAVSGVDLFALPTGILASGFFRTNEQKKEPLDTCPTCGQKIEK